MTKRPAIPIFFAMVAAALIIASVLRAPLSWDGSFYLFQILDRQSPFIPISRRINYLLQWPTLLAFRFTSNVKVLALIFSLSYAAVPMVGLAVSYLVCRKRPALFIWPALGVGLATLPGIFCFHSEATMTAPLFWPVFLATLVGVSPVEFPGVALLAMMMLITHPNSAALLALSAITAFVSATISPFKPLRFLGSLALGLLCIARLTIRLSVYERQQLSFSILGRTFRAAVEGWPLAFLALTLLAARLCLRQGLNRKPKTFASDLGLMGVVIAAGLMLVPWSINPHSWIDGIDYRLWVVPMSLTVMGACALDAWRKANQTSLWRERQPAVIAIGAVFLIILTLQAITWNRLTNRLIVALAGSGCIQHESLDWTMKSALNHWSIASYAIVLQGRTPHTIVLGGAGCDQYAADGTVNIIWLKRKKGGGWFDLDQVDAEGQASRAR